MATSTPLTSGRLLDIDEGIGALMRAYTSAEVELRRDLERLVRTVALDPTSSARFRAQQRRALLTRIGVMRADLIGKTTVFAEESMARIYAQGMLRADVLSAAAGLRAGPASFTQVHRAAVEILAMDSFDDLARSVSFLEPQAKRVLREAAKARTTIGALTGSSVRSDTSALVRELTTRGVTGFVDKAGRNWRLSTYAEMVIRTKSAQAYNTGTVLRAEETGTEVFVIRDGERSGHKECLAFADTTADARWSLANPIQHPNCVRSFGPSPLHTGPVTHTLGGRAEDDVFEERARRELPSDLVIVPPDLTR
jgi:hypothetical protein